MSTSYHYTPRQPRSAVHFRLFTVKMCQRKNARIRESRATLSMEFISFSDLATINRCIANDECEDRKSLRLPVSSKANVPPKIIAVHTSWLFAGLVATLFEPAGVEDCLEGVVRCRTNQRTFACLHLAVEQTLQSYLRPGLRSREVVRD